MGESELACGVSSGQWGKDDSLFRRCSWTRSPVLMAPSDDVTHDFWDCCNLLLDGGDVYSHDRAGRTFGSYSRKAVSLHNDAGEARYLTMFACDACRLAAEEEGVQMLRDPVETKHNLQDPGFCLYSDPIFKREHWNYVGFIELLRPRHLVRFKT